jgi:hypothetical protein
MTVEVALSAALASEFFRIGAFENNISSNTIYVNCTDEPNQDLLLYHCATATILAMKSHLN